MFNKVSKVFRKKKSSSKLAKPDQCHGDRLCTDGSSAAVGDTCRQFERVHGSAEVCCVASANPSTCLSGAKNCELVLTQCSSGEVIHKWRAHEKEITKVSCGGQHRELLASASRDKTLCLWRREAGSSQTVAQHQYTGHDLVVTGVTLSSPGTQMLSGSRDNTLRLWDVSGGECIRMTALAQNVVTHVCWGRTPGSGSSVAQSSEDKTVRLWDTRSLRVATTTAAKQYIQTCCDLSGTDDHHCLSASNGFSGSGCEATLWDLRAATRPLHELTGHFETVTGCCFVPLSSHFVAATCLNDGTVRLWDCHTGNLLATVSIPASGPLTSISAELNGSLYVSSFHAGIQVISVQQNVGGSFELRRTAAF